MRVFKQFPKNKNCLICGDGHDDECTLVAIVGSNKDGGLTYEANPVHIECLDLFYDANAGFIYQRLKRT